MRYLVWSLFAVSLVMVRVERAEACACCDAKFKRTPIAWDESGAVLISASDTLACEAKKRFEVWTVDKEAPTGCFDMYGDPEKEIACEDITSAGSPKDRPKTASKAARKRFTKNPTRLSGTKFRVKQSKKEGSDDELDVAVELKTKTGWTSAWSGTMATTGSPIKLDVSVWPSPKGDRAVVLVGYVVPGTGNEQVDVHWAPFVK